MCVFKFWSCIFAISSKKAALSKFLKLLNVDLVFPMFGVVLFITVLIILWQSLTPVEKFRVLIQRFFEFVNMTSNKEGYVQTLRI